MASSHLQLFFARTINLRKDAVAGGTLPAGDEPLVRVVKAGEVLSVTREAGAHLIIEESAYEVKGSNRDKIEKIKAEIAEHQKNSTPQAHRKAA